MRIVSLVPSLSLTLCDLGLKEHLVGITTFCVRPTDLFRHAEIVGGTKNPDLKMIEKLNPTHILVNEEENKPEHIKQCERLGQTINTFPKKPEDSAALIRQLGEIFGVNKNAEEWAKRIDHKLEQLSSRKKKKGKYLYYIWKNPYMIAAKDTYINRMIELTGLSNAYLKEGNRYPELTIAEAKKLRPDYIFLSSEPYPFRVRDAEHFREEWGTEGPNLMKVDGQLCSWWGTLTAEALSEIDAFCLDLPQEMFKVF